MVAEQEASKSEVRHVLSRFFGNSREQLLLSLLGDDEISAEELKRLKDAIRDAAPDDGRGLEHVPGDIVGDLERALTSAGPWVGSALGEFSKTAAGVLVSSIWQGAIVACALAISLQDCASHFGEHRFLLWAGGFVTVACLSLLAFDHARPWASRARRLSNRVALRRSRGFSLIFAGAWQLLVCGWQQAFIAR